MIQKAATTTTTPYSSLSTRTVDRVVTAIGVGTSFVLVLPFFFFFFLICIKKTKKYELVLKLIDENESSIQNGIIFFVTKTLLQKH